MQIHTDALMHTLCRPSHYIHFPSHFKPTRNALAKTEHSHKTPTCFCNCFTPEKLQYASNVIDVYTFNQTNMEDLVHTVGLMHMGVLVHTDALIHTLPNLMFPIFVY